MVRVFVLLLLACVLAICLQSQSAAQVVLKPSPVDLNELDHAYSYLWKISWAVPAGEIITGAVLSLKDIDDWKHPEPDWLYMHLLDNPSTYRGTLIGSNATGKTYRWYDREGGGDEFAGEGPLIAVYSDPGPGKVDLNYDLKQLGLLDELMAYASDGNWGIGFDPDCHYYNCGISLTITTTKPSQEVIPEPASIILACLGLSTVAAIRRKKCD